MQKSFLYLLLLLVYFEGFCQIEFPKKAIKIAPSPSFKGEISPATTKVITYPSIFDKKDKLLENFSLLSEREEPEKSIFEKEKFDSQAEYYTKKINDQMRSEGNSSIVDYRDYYLGDFKIYTKKIIVMSRDFGAIDGDDVAIWLNGKKVIPIFTLEGSFIKYEFVLNPGRNRLEFEALNTGALYPNTGQFMLFDSTEKMITNQSWNLNAGFKGYINILQLEGLQEKESDR